MTLRQFCFLFLILLSPPLFAESPMDSLWQKLETEIQQKASYDLQKMQRIQALSSLCNTLNGETDLTYSYTVYLKLFNEYQSYQYDSSFYYAQKLLDIAHKTQNIELVAEAKINLSFILLSSGFFHESVDTLLSINPQALPQPLEVKYYTTLNRVWIDLADFSQHAHYSAIYNQKALTALTMALAQCDSTSTDFFMLNGLWHLRTYNMPKARYYYEKLATMPQNSIHQQAIIAASLSYIYTQLAMPEKSLEQLVTAAIFDIRSSTKETVALINLAEVLYHNGQIEYALQCINLALEDANFYGARHRKTQITSVLPIIEGTMLQIKEKQSRILWRYAIVVSFLIAVLVILTLITIRQNRHLQQARRILKSTIEALEHTNQNLLESNRIKEEYIGHFFHLISNYIDALDHLKKTVTRHLMAKKISGFDDLFQHLELSKERDQLLVSFDSTFMNLFPDFVATYNHVVADEDKVSTTEGVVFSPELRIYALKRLGINDNEMIAKFLGYSVSTIYTYKTKLKKRSPNPELNIDEVLMRIQLKT